MVQKGEPQRKLLIDPAELKSMPELAELFSINKDHLRELAAKGNFRAWYVGGSWLSTQALVAEFLKKPRRRGRPPKSDSQQ
jgi:excisionase family DNA binding protein